MTPELASASLYTDLQSLEGVRRRAAVDDEDTLRFAAQQFEALFLQTMLKSAREASLDDGLFDSEETDFYRDLHDKQLAIEMARGPGIGIADMLVDQLRRAGAGQAEQARVVKQIRELSDYLDARVQSPPATGFVGPLMPPPAPLSGEPEDFVRVLLPQAREAAGRLGVDPAVLLAQAALETGWGRAVTRHPDGRSSFNLFNIKADERWDGERVQVSTLEFRDGTFVRERAQFRAYDSWRESFRDYVDFLSTSRRYRPALEAAGDSARFVTELARAGYATDPRYAEKILGIVGRDPLRRLQGALVHGDDSFSDF